MQASRGEIWFVDLDPTRGREIRGERPCLVVSVNEFNHGPAHLIVVLPITSTQTGNPFHVQIEPPEGNVKSRSFIKTEQPRCISTDRLEHLWGSVASATMQEVSDRLRILLDL